MARTTVEPFPATQSAAPELPEPLRGFLERAIDERSTDLHFDEWEDGALVRFRVDGAVHVKERLTRGQADRVINQVRVAAELDIDTVRAPVEGHFRVRSGDRERNVRVTLVPTASRTHSAHLRLLTAPEDWRDIRRLGLAERDLEAIESAMRNPHGLVLAAGLTGSGKTTTLYALACLGEREQRIVVSIEDPVEFDLPRVRQLEVNESQGLTMEAGLRALLRMDPDILIIGEVRDRDSATIAAQAAMAGRLVLATVHGRDAAAAVESLHYLTVPNYVIGGALRLVIGQSLVRRVCEQCASTRPPAEYERALFKRARVPVPDAVREAAGCTDCNGYGYRGRIGVFEVVPIDDELGHWIARGQPQHAIRERFAAVSHGTIAADALRKAAAGLTSVREAMPLMNS